MGKATKAANSMYLIARYAAAEQNDNLSSREGAGAILGIDRTRLAHIELGTITPYPDEVRMMADAYNAPQLLSWHCARDCPIGKCIVPEIQLSSIEQIALHSAQALRNAEGIRESLIDIAADGQITEDEKPRLNQILAQMQTVSRVALELQTLVRRVSGQEV